MRFFCMSCPTRYGLRREELMRNRYGIGCVRSRHDRRIALSLDPPVRLMSVIDRLVAEVVDLVLWAGVGWPADRGRRLAPGGWWEGWGLVGRVDRRVSVVDGQAGGAWTAANRLCQACCQG